jgi:hypothetical protein|tara:strand:+ start:13 stop:516 length:504 start_codon:yes stop_codon:yes gene_type:complete
MPRPDEDPFLDCVECHGDNNRERRSDGSATCKHDGCKKAYARKRKAGGAGDITALPQQASVAPPAKCRKIKDVLGVSMVLVSELSSDERRVGRKCGDNDIHCAVRGGFGNRGDKAEDLIPDTRWVQLTDLVEALDKQQLKKLSAFAGKLQDALKLAEERVREDMEEE